MYARSEFAALVPAGVFVRSLECAELARLFVPGALQDASVRSTFGSYSAIYSWMGSQEREFVDQLNWVSDGRAQVLPFRPTETIEHQADFYLRCLAAPPFDCLGPRIDLGAEAISWREKFWNDNGLHPYTVLVIAPGSGAREKNWPEEFFIAIADWWRESIGGAVVLLVGPVEAERGGIDRLRQYCLVTENLNLAQVAALLAKSDIYVGNDSGTSHLAAAVGVRTVALFGPSDPWRWSPRGPKVTVIDLQIDCSPCSSS
ncbi:MAG TPA: glycosyltransferase family 9 protein, partial [Acidobacteriota bacterium]|nr:glycosyltransferase family 9 protein [Acidobacteriota bacterium]